MSEETRPPIPASCAHRPTVGGLVIPAVNLQLADGGADFRARHQAALDRCWQGRRCQVCDRPGGRPLILFGGPRHLRTGVFDEPPLCVACAQYASRACPMIAGRQGRFADRARISEGRRGQTCPDPGCDCGGWTSHDTGTGQDGAPAHPWYALFIDPHGYTVTFTEEEITCSDLGCRHVRQVVSGGFLNRPPLRVVLVSEPGAGRVWRRLTEAEAAGLLPPDYQLPEGAHLV